MAAEPFHILPHTSVNLGATLKSTRRVIDGRRSDLRRIVPGIVLYVYLGMLGKTAGSGGAAGGPLKWGFFGIFWRA